MLASIGDVAAAAAPAAVAPIAVAVASDPFSAALAPAPAMPDHGPLAIWNAGDDATYYFRLPDVGSGHVRNKPDMLECFITLVPSPAAIRQAGQAQATAAEAAAAAATTTATAAAAAAAASSADSTAAASSTATAAASSDDATVVAPSAASAAPLAALAPASGSGSSSSSSSFDPDLICDLMCEEELPDDLTTLPQPPIPYPSPPPAAVVPLQRQPPPPPPAPLPSASDLAALGLQVRELMCSVAIKYSARQPAKKSHIPVAITGLHVYAEGIPWNRAERIRQASNIAARFTMDMEEVKIRETKLRARRIGLMKQAALDDKELLDRDVGKRQVELEDVVGSPSDDQFAVSYVRRFPVKLRSGVAQEQVKTQPIYLPGISETMHLEYAPVVEKTSDHVTSASASAAAAAAAATTTHPTAALAAAALEDDADGEGSEGAGHAGGENHLLVHINTIKGQQYLHFLSHQLYSFRVRAPPPGYRVGSVALGLRTWENQLQPIQTTVDRYDDQLRAPPMPRDELMHLEPCIGVEVLATAASSRRHQKVKARRRRGFAGSTTSGSSSRRSAASVAARSIGTDVSSSAVSSSATTVVAAAVPTMALALLMDPATTTEGHHQPDDDGAMAEEGVHMDDDGQSADWPQILEHVSRGAAAAAASVASSSEFSFSSSAAAAAVAAATAAAAARADDDVSLLSTSFPLASGLVSEVERDAIRKRKKPTAADAVKSDNDRKRMRIRLREALEATQAYREHEEEDLMQIEYQ